MKLSQQNNKTFLCKPQNQQNPKGENLGCCTVTTSNNYNTTQKHLFHNYNYSYNITRKFKRTKIKPDANSLKLTFSCSRISGGCF
jgi:hypothetical protein